MSTQHKEVMLKKVVGGDTWKARCSCGENFRGKLKKDVEADLKVHLGGDVPVAKESEKVESTDKE